MDKFTKVQKEAWDKVIGPGLYDVFGDGGYDYLCKRIEDMLLYGNDRYTFLLIGSDLRREEFLRTMAALDLFEWPAWEPLFFCFQDREKGNDGEYYPPSLNSEDDTDRFCNFIRNAQTNQYNRVGAVLVLGEEDEIKHIDKLLKIPVWRGRQIFLSPDVCKINIGRLHQTRLVSPDRLFGRGR
jgi:hypothetical protein